MCDTYELKKKKNGGWLEWWINDGWSKIILNIPNFTVLSQSKWGILVDSYIAFCYNQCCIFHPRVWKIKTQWPLTTVCEKLRAYFALLLLYSVSYEWEALKTMKSTNLESCLLFCSSHLKKCKKTEKKRKFKWKPIKAMQLKNIKKTKPHTPLSIFLWQRRHLTVERKKPLMKHRPLNCFFKYFVLFVLCDNCFLKFIGCTAIMNDNEWRYRGDI